MSLLNQYYSLFPAQRGAALAKLAISETINHKKNLELYTDIKLFSAEKIMTKLSEESRQGEVINCHILSHQVGRVAYQVYKDGAFFKNIATCSSGYIHGVMAAFINDVGSDNVVQKADSVCQKAPTVNAKDQCYHGVGHGLMAYVNNDVPTSIQKCQEFIDENKVKPCLLGIFMENIGTAVGDSLSHQPTQWVSKTDTQFPCTNVDQSSLVQKACYQMQAGWLLILNKNDKKATAHVCSNVPEIGRETCFRGLGQLTALETPKEPAKTVAICQSVTTIPELTFSCLVGAQAMLMNYWEGDHEQKVTEFCKALPQQYTANCYNQLEQRLGEL